MSTLSSLAAVPFPSRLRPPFALHLLALSLASGFAWGADGPAPSEPALAVVSVTAKGYAADELETPLSTVSLDREEIVRRGANNSGELLRGEPGIAVASDGAQGQNPVLRGLKKESVVLLVDGIRLNSAQPQGAIASFMSLGLAERVEVVKGPSSVLYGSGALGGVVNVRLPQAQFKAGTSGSALASWDSASNGLRATGVVNFSAGDHALMLGTSSARIGDYRSPDGKVAKTGYDSDSLIGQYRFRIDGAQQLRLSFQEHTDEDVWYPGSTKAAANPIKSTTIYSPKQSRRLMEAGYSRQGSGEAPLNFDFRVYRQEMERQVYSWASGIQRNNAETKVSFVTEGWDAKADWLVHPQHLLSFGINAWEMEASPNRRLYQAGNMVPNNPFADGRIESLGAYLQDDMRFGRLNVLAGLRHDTVKGSAASMNNGAVNNGLSRSDSSTSGSLGAVYEAAPLLRPYANLSRAFRAGEMRERYESSPRGDGYYYVGNPQIKPEEATQFELGLKGASADFNYRLAAYRNSIDNYITGRPTGAVISGLPVKATVNLGRAVIAGVEASARWQVRPGQWLNAGYSRLRGENKDLDEPLFQMPADELSLGWDGAVAQGWRADATLRLVARQNRVATAFSLGSEDVTAGFATADLGATYRWSRQSFRVALKNLADKRYHEHLAEGVSGNEILAPGRSLVLTWKGDF